MHRTPATLGQDSFLLTNPAGLRMMYTGLVAELGGGWRILQGRVSFMAVKSYGPTNPGNSVIENDAGVLGALFQDPNTAIHAAGRTYFDRAYVTKAELLATLPQRLGGIELANAATYMDGLPFGRRLLVTGLPQGPFSGGGHGPWKSRGREPRRVRPELEPAGRPHGARARRELAIDRGYPEPAQLRQQDSGERYQRPAV